jgi:uncharacterized protein YggU (UPF0235/DUF167 family)
MTTTSVRVKVKPNSRVSTLTQEPDGSWLARLKAAPVDGKANEELIALVADHFQCRKAQVIIKSGASARLKVLTIQPDPVGRTRQ